MVGIGGVVAGNVWAASGGSWKAAKMKMIVRLRHGAVLSESRNIIEEACRGFSGSVKYWKARSICTHALKRRGSPRSVAPERAAVQQPHEQFGR